MNATPSANRLQIAFFGRRNAGKSSVVNAFTGQNLAIVSSVQGTTTDPVTKAMELLPMGPVVIIDTPGIDDEGELGQLRVERTRRVLDRADLAILVVDGTLGKCPAEEALIEQFKARDIPWLEAWNKADLVEDRGELPENALWVSALTGDGIYELKERAARIAEQAGPEPKLIGDLISPGDRVMLVVPVDSAAPKGRLILPQQQVIRDVLDHGAIAVTARESELAEALAQLKEPPRIVVTDSQAFQEVSRIVPEEIPLTSFSILMARYKGNLAGAVSGVAALDDIRDGDGILISEGCTHHRQCDDIGTVKMPRWIREYTGTEPEFQWTSGGEFPEDLSPYRLVVHCGGCMLNQREMQSRARHAAEQGVPFTNYGLVIAQVTGILRRSLEPLPGYLSILD